MNRIVKGGVYLDGYVMGKKWGDAAAEGSTRLARPRLIAAMRNKVARAKSYKEATASDDLNRGTKKRDILRGFNPSGEG